MDERSHQSNMFKEIFEESQRKKERENHQYREKMSFLEYLNLVKENPSLAVSAHKRVYDAIVSKGSTPVLEGGERMKKFFANEDTLHVYPFFSEEFFGIEIPLAQIARYFRSAAFGGEESRQILYLMGPVGTGKSSIVERIREGLMESNPFYALGGCPMHEDPLLLVPMRDRPKVSEILGINIKGDICSVCRYKLKEELRSQFQDFPVVLTKISKRKRIGLAQIPPVDPNNQDTSVLIGSEDISKLDIYPEGDPRVLNLDGALNAANRGMAEFIEIFKNEAEYLHCIITATQEKIIPAPGRHGMLHVDLVIIGHSNLGEWSKFKSDPKNEAILDRIVLVKVPYNLRLTEEIKIYEKILKDADFNAHIAPHTLKIASMFAILSRLKLSKTDLVTKLKIYDGEDVIEKGQLTRMTIDELREEARGGPKEEGMEGISTRFIMKALDNALSDSKTGCINPIGVREALKSKVMNEDLSDDTRKTYLELLDNTIHKEYLGILEKEITKAFVYSYSEQAEQLFQNYLDHVEAFVNKSKVKDPTTNEELEPDEKFLASIEQQIGVTGNTASGFRQDVVAFMLRMSRRGERLEYQSYAPLREAIEKKLAHSVRELSRIVTKARTRDEEQQEKHNDMVEQMKENDYCDHCVEVVLRYAVNNLWKD